MDVSLPKIKSSSMQVQANVNIINNGLIGKNSSRESNLCEVSKAAAPTNRSRNTQKITTTNYNEKPQFTKNTAITNLPKNS
jgi:hypothetical protein